MKTKILMVMLTLILSGMMVFAQSNTMSDKKDSLSVKMEQQKDSVYYGCVPCCQKCSVFKTDKPGECPICGMTLERRSVIIENKAGKADFPINKNDCKKPKRSSAK